MILLGAQLQVVDEKVQRFGQFLFSLGDRLGSPLWIGSGIRRVGLQVDQTSNQAFVHLTTWILRVFHG